MRTAISVVLAALLIISGCKKDDFQYSFGAPSKLLVMVKENGQLAEEFKYDSLNRVIQADRFIPGDTVILSQYFEYDSKNRLTCKTSGEYTESYQYDGSGRLVTVNLHFKPASDGSGWDQKTGLRYSKGRISGGIVFARDGSESGYITYRYDSRGNTIERTEYSGAAGYEGLIISQYKFAYDEKINPRPVSAFPFWNLSQADIVQGNNPIYAYYYNISMSSLPPQYEFTYDYDDTGLPAKGYRVKVYEVGDPDISEYEYIDKHE